MSEDEARREVRRAVEAQGGRVEFAEKAGVDPGTLGDFLDGRRWAQARTRTKIEQALGWPAGRIMDLREGVEAEPDEPDVLDAIRRDPHLLPEARDHLINQYGLLRRLQARSAQQVVEDEVAKRRQQLREGEQVRREE